MYFFKYHPLKEKLRDREVSDREALPYLVVFAGLNALTMGIPLGYDFNGWDWISSALSFVLAIAGIFYAYHCNGGRQGYDLIHKYVVLGWVVAIRWILFFIPLAIVAAFIGALLNVLTDETGPFDVLLISAFEIVLYLNIGKHIRDTRAA